MARRYRFVMTLASMTHAFRPAPTPPGAPARSGDLAEFEYRVLTVPRDTPRAEVRRLLTEQAEYGRWELARTVVYAGGRRSVWVRRRVIRVARTV